MGMLPNFAAKRPHVAEHDFSGVVVDANGTDLKNGEEVYGFIPVRTSNEITRSPTYRHSD